MVLVSGLVAAVAGWVLVRATIGQTPAGASAEAPSHDGAVVDSSPEANATGEAPANANAVDAHASPVPNPSTDAVEPSGSNAIVEAEPTTESPTVETPTPLPPSSTAGTTVRRGRVAYIRCGDTERCPRDAVLEDAAWAIVDALPSCARLVGQTGSADVRFHFEAETVEVRFRDHGDRPLAIPALRACLVGPSASLRTTLTPRPLTASFRFDLVAE